MDYLDMIDTMLCEVDDVMSEYPNTELHKLLDDLYGALCEVSEHEQALRQMTKESSK